MGKLDGQNILIIRVAYKLMLSKYPLETGCCRVGKITKMLQRSVSVSENIFREYNLNFTMTRLVNKFGWSSLLTDQLH